MIICPLLAASVLAVAQPEPDPLGGPPVDPASSEPTLVERDYEGRLRELTARPEIAAVDLLTLKPEERGPVRAVIEARGAHVERVVFANLALLAEVATAEAALRPGQTWDDVDPDLRQRTEAALAELFTGDRLIDQIAAALPERVRPGYRRAVNSWYAAAIAEHDPEADALYEVTKSVVSREVRSAYERGVAGRQREFSIFLEKLGATPEQEGTIRALAEAWYMRVNGQPTEADRRQLFLDALAVLSPEQRRAAIERFRE